MNEIAVIVPTYGRAKEIRKTAKHLNETAKHEMLIYFIADESDKESLAEIESLMKEMVNVRLLTTSIRGVGKIYEFGYHNTTEDYVFMAADDMVFPDGWLMMAMDQIGDKGAIAIADENSGSWCLFMVKRDYVQEKSCVEDRSNTMLNTDYDRIADAEFVFTLDARGDLAYATFFINHMTPVFYGQKKMSSDGQTQEISYNQFLIRDLMIPYADVHADIVQDSHTGVRNILKIKIVPKNPIITDNFRYDEYTKESNSRDEEIMQSRRHLWGGKCQYRFPPKIHEVL
jgi:glycosyltransferase involved in cell wall biosynthesis